MALGNLEKFFNDVITVERITSVADEYGGLTKSYVTTEPALKCRVYGTPSGRDVIGADGQSYQIETKIMCGVLADVLPSDVVTDGSGSKYSVIKICVRSGMKDAHHKELWIARINAL